MKKCSKCSESKELSCFGLDKSRSDGHSYICKDCIKVKRDLNKDKNRERNIEHYKKNRDKIIEQQNKYYYQNRSKKLESQKEYYKQNKMSWKVMGLTKM